MVDKRSLFWISIVCLICLQGKMTGQSFEGVISLTSSNTPEQSMRVTLKDGWSLLEISPDTQQTVKVIKNKTAGTTTILRSKGNLKYGYRSNTLVGDDSPAAIQDPDAKHIQTEETQLEKKIGAFNCVRIDLRSPKASAEAWVTRETSLRLSACFPFFLGDGTDPDLYALRQLADAEGLILEYRERSAGDTQETLFQVTAIPEDISLDAFSVDDTYQVLDEQGIRSLYMQAQKDPVKQQEWEEFRAIFGNN